MRPMDVSRPPRSLDGSAREPAELLDQLRRRLDQLPENHPSASRSVAGRVTADAPREDRDAPDRAAAHRDAADRDTADRDTADARPDDHGTSAAPHEANAAHVPRDGQDAAEAPRDGQDAAEAPPEDPDRARAPRDQRDVGDPGQLGTWAAGTELGAMDIGGATPADGYRPWFISGESGAPWFALDSDAG